MLSDANKRRLFVIENATAITPGEFTELALSRLEHLAARLEPGRQIPDATGVRLEMGLLTAMLFLADHAEYLGERVATIGANPSPGYAGELPAPVSAAATANAEGDIHD